MNLDKKEFKEKTTAKDSMPFFFLSRLTLTTDTGNYPNGRSLSFHGASLIFEQIVPKC